MPNLARIAAFLNHRLKKYQPATFIALNSDELQVMETLKNALIPPPIFAMFYSLGHNTLYRDVCNVQTSRVLLQKQLDDTTIPIGYCSRSVTDTVKQYDTSQRKNLAIV